MSRRRRVIKKRVLVDVKFGSPLAARFITSLMRDGKKSIAENIFYSTLDIIGQRVQDPPPSRSSRRRSTA